MTLRTLLIDDHMLFREGLTSLLKRRNIEVLAAVGDGNEGIRLAQELNPDIILLDMRMPILDGISVLKHLNGLKLEIPIVMLTTSSNEQDLLGALRAGARGYLLKDNTHRGCPRRLPYPKQSRMGRPAAPLGCLPVGLVPPRRSAGGLE